MPNEPAQTVQDELDRAGALLIRLERERDVVKARHAEELRPYSERVKAVREHIAALFSENGKQQVMPL